MANLGYEQFLAHGSDMGAGVVERLRADHPHRLLGIHMVNVFSGYPAASDLDDEERAFLDIVPQWRMAEGAYAMLHATKPRTIAVALNDSPAGLAAWIAEKFHDWTDDRKVSNDCSQHDPDRLLGHRNDRFVAVALPRSRRRPGCDVATAQEWGSGGGRHLSARHPACPAKLG